MQRVCANGVLIHNTNHVTVFFFRNIISAQVLSSDLFEMRTHNIFSFLFL